MDMEGRWRESWVGEGISRRIGGVRVGCGEGQGRWPVGHENEWIFETDLGEEVGDISRMRQRPGIREEPKHQWE